MSDEHPAASDPDPLEFIRRMRALYDLPAEPVVPPTLEEIMAAQRRGAAQAILSALRELRQTGSGTDPMTRWYQTSADKRDLPQYAQATIEQGCWTAEAAADLVQAAWVQPEWPVQASDAQEWRDECRAWVATFERVRGTSGPLTDYDEPCTLPVEVTCYRAAMPGYERGLSWTTNIDTARWFAARPDFGPGGRRPAIWRTVVARSDALAHFTQRGEDEVVLDPANLEITLHTDRETGEAGE